MNINQSKENTVFEAGFGLSESEREQSVISIKSTKIFSIENVKTSMRNVKTPISKKVKNGTDVLSKGELLESYREIRDIKLLGRKRNSVPVVDNVNGNNGIGNVKLARVDFKPSGSYAGDLREKFKATLYNPEWATRLPSDKVTIRSNGLDANRSTPNEYNPYFRLEEANRLHFIRNFQEDYAPIKMQKDNEKIFESIANGDAFTKTHFIKKKQSAVNIKRQSGVSYVVETESKQLNVESTYKPLGHLVYQGTHSVQQLNDEIIICHIDDIITKHLMNGPLLVSIFDSPDEDEMKQYLLKPNERFKLTKE
jgi:hypothetical protein